MIASVRLIVHRMTLTVAVALCVVVLVAFLLPAGTAAASASDTVSPSAAPASLSSASATASLIEGPGLIDVPDVVEKTVGETRAAVEAAGLVFDGAGGREDGLIVATQDPEAGTAVPVGSTVKVTVRPPPTVDVPPVVGKTLGEARAAVEAADLIFSGGGARDDGLIVATQDPEAGTAVPVGSTVTVTVRPPPTVDVPNVVEKTVGEARAAVEGTERLVFAGAGEGEDGLIVAAQDPKAGTQVKVGSTVTVTVRRPPPEVVPDVTVPDLVGKTVGEARAAVEGTERLVFAGAGEGEDKLIVATQDPKAGTPVKVGSTVTVTVRRPPPEVVPDVIVPDVVGKTVEAARAAVEGTERLVFAGAGEGEDKLIVATQDPKAGTQAKVGSTVTVTVRRPPPEVVPPVVPPNVAPPKVAPPKVTVPKVTVPDVTVPDVVDLTVGAARAAVKEAELVLAGVDEGHESFTILTQAPSEGTRVAPGSPVTVTVKKVSEVVVPNVVGSPIGEARIALQRVDLILARAPRDDDLIITGQKPPADSLVAPRTIVLVTTELVAVPNVLGLEVVQAQDVVQDLGLVLDPDLSTGTVFAQQPRPGEQALPGSVVTAIVASPPSAGVVVPNVLGLPVEQAREALQRSGIALGGLATDGAVVTGQRPAAGAEVSRGSSVTVTTPADPPTGVTVPAVLGQSVEQARTALEAVGLVLAAQDQSGRITAQQPPSGTQVDLGSTITVAVEAPLPAEEDGLPLSSTVLAFAGLFIGAAASAAGTDTHRRRRWVNAHVHMAPSAEPPEVTLHDIGTAPTQAIRLQRSHTQPIVHVEEVLQ